MSAACIVAVCIVGGLFAAIVLIGFCQLSGAYSRWEEEQDDRN